MSGITNPAEEYFKDGVWGWDGTQWRKLNLTWGYADRWSEQVIELNASAGTNSLLTTAVPAGYVYILQAASVRDVNTAATREAIMAFNGSVAYWLMVKDTATVNMPYMWQGEIVLKAGDQVRGYFEGCALNDDLYLQCWGYKMRVS